MYISIDKQGAISALEKKIAECVIAESVTLRGIEGMKSVKHHKEINKRVITAIQALGGYASLYMSYTPRIVLYFDQDKRIYTHSKPDSNGMTVADYFSETQVDIYFTGGYTEMIESSRNRLSGIIQSRERYQAELDNMDAIIEDVQALHKAYKKVENHSYIIREVFGIK